MRLINILGWIAVIIFVILLAWRVLGSSPTIDQLSLIFGMIGIWVTYKGTSKIDTIDRKLDKHTNLLTNIEKKVKRKL